MPRRYRFGATAALLLISLSVPAWAQPIYEYDGSSDAAGGGAFDALDGTFSHDNGSDEWDGEGFGAGNPGGVESIDGFLRIQDPGDPRDHGNADPGSNRKVYLGHDLSADGASDTMLDDGVVLRFRARLSPEADDLRPDGGGGVVAFPGADGYMVHDGGKGNISLKQAAGGVISFCLITDGDAGLGDGLIMNNLNGSAVSGDVDQQGGDPGEINLVALNPSEWHDFVVVIRAGGTGTHQASISVDGAPAGTFDVTAGTGSDFDGISYLAIGAGATPQSGAIDIDHVSVSAIPAAQVPLLSNWGTLLLVAALTAAGAAALRARRASTEG